jgi:Kef-type K+ transport system membrane component KefB
MESIYTIASLWLGLAVISAIVANHLKISIALVEICVGILAATVTNHFYGPIAFGSNLEWLRFLASRGGCNAYFFSWSRA